MSANAIDRHKEEQARLSRAMRLVDKESRAEVNGYDIFSDLLERVHNTDTPTFAQNALYDAVRVLDKDPGPDSPEKYLALNAIRLARIVLMVEEMIEAAQGAAQARVYETHELVTPEALEAKLDESFRNGAEAMRLQFVEAAEKAVESQRAAEKAPRSRRLKLVPKAPASKRAPASSKAVRRAS